MEQSHTSDERFTNEAQPFEDRPVERKPEPAKFEPKIETAEDHVSHIANLVRNMQKTQPGSASFAVDIMHHVTALQNPESYNAAEAERQRLAFEADELSARKRGRVKADVRAA